MQGLQLFRPQRSAHRRASVKFDLIDVSEGDPEVGTYLAHRYALDTATPVVVEVRDRGAELLVAASVPVATLTALVAMKVHAIESRRATNPDKISGDLFDVVQLVTMYGPEKIGAGLRSQTVLAGSVRTRCERYFLRDAARTLQLLRRDTRTMVADVDRLDIETASLLVYELS